MDTKKCKNCCDYDSPKGSKSGYCTRAKKNGCGVVAEDHVCDQFLEGNFKERFKIRKINERKHHEKD